MIPFPYQEQKHDKPNEPLMVAPELHGCYAIMPLYALTIYGPSCTTQIQKQCTSIWHRNLLLLIEVKVHLVWPSSPAGFY